MGALVAALVLAVAACGDGDDEAEAAETTTTLEPTTTTTGTTPAPAEAVTVTDAWYRVVGDDMGAAYFNATNNSDDPVVFRAATSPSAEIEIHETTLDSRGVMSMQEQPDGFTIAPGETLVLEPGGKHLMLLGLDAPSSGELTLELDFGGEIVTVTATYDAESSTTGDLGEDHAGMHGSATGEVGDMLEALNVGGLHALEDELTAGTFAPAEQLVVAQESLAAVQEAHWPDEVETDELEAALTALVEALEAEDQAAATAAATEAHRLAHDLEHALGE